MSYNHKKSLRKVTDVQMSEGTSVDGSRIDRALDESTDRFNNLEGGDFAQMFTKTQFVFGMQPSPIVPAPLADPSTTALRASTHLTTMALFLPTTDTSPSLGSGFRGFLLRTTSGPLTPQTPAAEHTP